MKRKQISNTKKEEQQKKKWKFFFQRATWLNVKNGNTQQKRTRIREADPEVGRTVHFHGKETIRSAEMTVKYRDDFSGIMQERHEHRQRKERYNFGNDRRNSLLKGKMSVVHATHTDRYMQYVTSIKSGRLAERKLKKIELKKTKKGNRKEL